MVNMKTIGIIVMAIPVLLVYACTNHPGKKTANDSAMVHEPMTQTPVTKRSDKIERNEFKVCDSIAKEILTTSPRFKKITKGLGKAVIKNGGLSFGIRMEGSPNFVQDKSWKYSKTYDFTLYEIYADRELNTARFTFNPDKKQLYEYDEVFNQLKPIEFDRSLLIAYDAICK